MATSYSKIGKPKASLGFTHPFKVDIIKNGRNANGGPQYQLAINYKSKLLNKLKLDASKKFLIHELLTIKGLDFVKDVPSSFPGKNFYCVLKIRVDNLKASDPEIIWVEDDKSVKELNPVVFRGKDDLTQTEARVIIGVLVNDRESVAGTTDGSNEVTTDYFMQFINTHLMVTPLIFDGVPIIYPIPYSGWDTNDSGPSTPEPPPEPPGSEGALTALQVLNVLEPMGVKK